MCSRLELVLKDVLSTCEKASTPAAYVTMTTPLALTQERMTWVAVAPSLFAAALTGLSTGPPGYLVMGLHEWWSASITGVDDTF